MSLFDILLKAGLAVTELREFLLKAAAASPELAAKAKDLVDALDAATTPEALAVLGQTILGELASISQGKLDGRSHPSDAA